jgi:oligosaccharyltransferase complex subunit alpha (ribophorin I)
LVAIPSLPKATVESHTTVSPSSLEGSNVVYGPYKDVPKHTSAAVNIHYENNNALLAVRSHRRELWLSHWGGNLAVEEHYDAYHAGAKCVSFVFISLRELARS